MELHPHGDNIFLGGLDRVFSWIDLELSSKPWKSLQNHSSAIRSLAYHNRYPLLATTGDDATVIVYHARVSRDFTHDNELVPVKRLFGHKLNAQKEFEDAKRAIAEKDADSTTTDKMTKPNLTILSVVFHPSQPWLITGGADGQIGLFS
jgi:ribosome biogenesis protein ERB1